MIFAFKMGAIDEVSDNECFVPHSCRSASEYGADTIGATLDAFVFGTVL